MHITKKQKHFRMTDFLFIKSLSLVFYFVLLINFSFIKLLNILVTTNASFTFLSKTKICQLSGKYCIHCDVGEMKHFKTILHIKCIVFKWDMKCTIMQLRMYGFQKWAWARCGGTRLQSQLSAGRSLWVLGHPGLHIKTLFQKEWLYLVLSLC